MAEIIAATKFPKEFLAKGFILEPSKMLTMNLKAKLLNLIFIETLLKLLIFSKSLNTANLATS